MIQGLAALSLDALSSVAYGPEAIVIVLVAACSGALTAMLPITLAIAGLLAVLVVSYRQVTLVPRGAGGGDRRSLPRAVSAVRGRGDARPARRPGGHRRDPRSGRPGDRGDREVRAHAKLHLEHLGLDVDALFGSLWAEGKAEALRKHDAQVYVGDIVGAHTAGALSVAVATGPCDATVLRNAGAEVVLADLTEFPSWLERYVAERADGGDAATT